MKELITYGVEPLLQLVGIFKDELDREPAPDERLNFIYSEMLQKLTDMKACIYRFTKEQGREATKL